MRGVFVDANEALAVIFERLTKPGDPAVRIHRDPDVTPEQLPAVLDGASIAIVDHTALPTAIARQCRSTVTLEDNSTGDQITDVAHMNHPIYFHSGDWLFFQASYDSQHGKPAFTELGVGNRPGVWVMIGGCLMIFVGLMYAFYAKPLIIRRMKRKAIEKAQAAGKLAKVREAEELVSSN